MRPQSGKVAPLKKLNEFTSRTQNYQPVINVAGNVGANSIQKIRASLAKSGIEATFNQNGESVEFTAAEKKPRPFSAASKFSKQRPWSSKPQSMAKYSVG